MKILAVDTSALTASVAVMDGETIKGEISFTTGLTHSQTIMPMVDELLKSLSLTCDDIDLFACSNGPGSFTGLRIGIGTIKGLAYGCGKEVVGVSTLEALAYNVASSGLLVAPIMDARRNQVYNALYKFHDGKIECIEPPRALSIEELAQSLPEKTIFVGDGVKVYKDTLKKLMGENAVFSLPQHCLQSAASVCFAASLKEPCDVNDLSVIYLRKPQAERELEEKSKL